MSADLNLIHRTFQSMSADTGEQWLTRTYALFAERCPEGAALWATPDVNSQGKMFNAILLSVMDGLTQPETQHRNLVSDVREHKGYGVDRAMYGLFLHAMGDALREVGGEAIPDEEFSAWERQLLAIEGQVGCLSEQQEGSEE